MYQMGEAPLPSFFGASLCMRPKRDSTVYLIIGVTFIIFSIINFVSNQPEVQKIAYTPREPSAVIPSVVVA